jgi:hypothetical protein
LLYVEAVNEAEIFESNYKQSAFLDFENFISLKYQEVAAPLTEQSVGDEESNLLIKVNNTNNSNCTNLGSNMLNIQNLISEIKTKLHNTKGQELDEETKEKVIDLLYEYDGYYSVNKSYYNLFGSATSTKKKISLLFYVLILFLFLFMIFTIYFALYNFFINKTLVVNIFLQIK